MEKQKLEGGHNLILTVPSGLLNLVPPSSDLDAEMALLRTHPEAIRYLPFMPRKVDVEDMKKRREYRAKNDTIMDFNILLTADDGQSSKLIGISGLFNIDKVNETCSTGILIHPDYFRAGHATQVLYTVMKYAFEDDTMHMHRVTFETGENNVRMRGWLENVLGIEREFTWREAWKAEDGSRIDVVGYSALAQDWGDIKRQMEARIGKACIS